MAKNNDKIVIDEKTIRREMKQRQLSNDKDYIKKTSIIRIVIASIIALASIALMIVVICFTHDKPYFGFGYWAGILAFYLCHKSRKAIMKALGEIKKLNNPFNFV